MKDFANRVEQGHAKLYKELQECKDTLNSLSFRDASDVGYYLKWAGELFDDLRKECNKLSEIAQKVAVLRWMHMPEGERGEKLVTNDYTATPDVKFSANLPSHSKEPEKYKAFLAWLGVPDELIESELLRVHWPNFSEYFTMLQQEGRPLPPGIDPDKTHAHHHMKYRTKKRVS